MSYIIIIIYNTENITQQKILTFSALCRKLSALSVSLLLAGYSSTDEHHRDQETDTAQRFCTLLVHFHSNSQSPLALAHSLPIIRPSNYRSLHFIHLMMFLCCLLHVVIMFSCFKYVAIMFLLYNNYTHVLLVLVIIMYN